MPVEDIDLWRRDFLCPCTHKRVLAYNPARIYTQVHICAPSALLCLVLYGPDIQSTTLTHMPKYGLAGANSPRLHLWFEHTVTIKSSGAFVLHRAGNMHLRVLSEFSRLENGHREIETRL